MPSPLPGNDPAQPAPDCSRPLLLRDCLERWRTEARHGVFDTGRYRCPFVLWGGGPALVLIPGMGLDAVGFVMLMARLQTDFCCISFDLPNGENDGARVTAYRHADHVADLLALLDHLSIRACILLGSSFGSTIALKAASEQPARFPRLILQGGFAHRPLAWTEVLAASFCRYLPGRTAHLPLALPVLERVQRPSFHGREPAVWDFFVRESLHIPLCALAARALETHHLDLRPILPTIQQPVLMICGDRDPLVGKTCEAELRGGLPNVARAEIENCGHMPQLTHPEVLAEIIRGWGLGMREAKTCPASG